jgi:DNA-directed RNA polymerase subunit L
MEAEIVKLEKDLCEVKIDNITVAEILRVYLNNQGIKFAAWRREHPEKPILFRIESAGSSVKKAISSAISGIEKDLNVFLKGIKK